MRSRGRSPRAALAAVITATLALAAARPAAAQIYSSQAWIIIPLETTGVDPTAARTFLGLLREEIGRRAGARFLGAPTTPCSDGSCAVAVGRATGARYVVWGEASALGAKVIVTISTADATRNAILSTQRVAAPRVEELDTLAVQIVQAIVAGRSLDTVAQARPAPQPAPQPAPPTPPGYPPAPAYPPPDAYPRPTPAPMPGENDSTLGMMLRFGAFIPLGKGYAGNPGGGISLAAGWWFESGHLAVEPRIAVNFDAETESESKYVEVPIDVGAFWLMTSGDLIPFLGGGVGARYLWEKKVTTMTLGETLPSTATRVDEDRAWGAGLYVRGGLMLRAGGRRHTRSKILLTAEYSSAFLKVNGFSNPQSVIVAGTVVF
jgi:hypothetical protein